MSFFTRVLKDNPYRLATGQFTTKAKDGSGGSAKPVSAPITLAAASAPAPKVSAPTGAPKASGGKAPKNTASAKPKHGTKAGQAAYDALSHFAHSDADKAALKGAIDTVMKTYPGFSTESKTATIFHDLKNGKHGAPQSVSTALKGLKGKPKETHTYKAIHAAFSAHEGDDRPAKETGTKAPRAEKPKPAAAPEAPKAKEAGYHTGKDGLLYHQSVFGKTTKIKPDGSTEPHDGNYESAKHHGTQPNIHAGIEAHLKHTAAATKAKQADKAKEHAEDIGKAPAAPKEAEKPAAAKPAIPDASTWKKVKGQMGSNPGGVYEAKDGSQHYVKEAKSKDHLEAELLAARTYEKLGVETLNPQAYKLGDKHAIGTKLVHLSGFDHETPKHVADAQKDFVAHAFLGNWDAVGLTYDNVGYVGGKLAQLDGGGSLKYRAQGEKKPFGNSVDELTTMRNPAIAPQAAKVFGSMTPAQIKESAKPVLALTDKDIDGLVDGSVTNKAEAADLKKTLKNRRDSIAAQVAATAPAKPNLQSVAAAKTQAVADALAAGLKEAAKEAASAPQTAPDHVSGMAAGEMKHGYHTGKDGKLYHHSSLGGVTKVMEKGADGSYKTGATVASFESAKHHDLAYGPVAAHDAHEAHLKEALAAPAQMVSSGKITAKPAPKAKAKVTDIFLSAPPPDEVKDTLTPGGAAKPAFDTKLYWKSNSGKIFSKVGDGPGEMTATTQDGSTLKAHLQADGTVKSNNGSVIGGPQKEPGAAPAPLSTTSLAGKAVVPETPTPAEATPTHGTQKALAEAAKVIAGSRVLTHSELLAIKSYQGSGYTDINAALRRGKSIDKAEFKKIREINRMIEDHTTHEDIHVYRGVKSTEEVFGTTDMSAVIGKGLLDNGFMSTSTDRDFSKGWASGGGSIKDPPLLLEFKLPKGSAAMPITHHTGTHVGESELLLGRGTMLQVKSVRQEMVYGKPMNIATMEYL